MVPAQRSSNIGEGVHEIREGCGFRFVELKEFSVTRTYSTFLGLGKLLSTERPDIVIATEFHLFTFILNIPVVFAMKRNGIKLILKSIPFKLPTYSEAQRRIKEGEGGFSRAPGWMRKSFQYVGIAKLARYGMLRLKRTAFKRPDAHVVYIEDGKRIYASYGVDERSVFVTYNSPDTDKMFAARHLLESDDSRFSKSDCRMIHVGRLVEWKRVDLLIGALAKIKKQFPEAELLILGYGPLEGDLKRLAERLGVGSDVKFVGGVYDMQELGRYLMSSTVYVLAGMGGLSINDAMCFGLPVVCSVCDGTEKHLVEDGFNGKYFEEGNEDDLVDKITEILSHPELATRMGANSTRIISEKVNIHTVVKGYVEAFNYVTSAK